MPYLEIDLLLSLRKTAAFFLLCGRDIQVKYLFTQATAKFIIKQHY